MRGAAGPLVEDTKIELGNPNLMYLRQKSKSHLLMGNCVLSPAARAPRLNRGRTIYAYILPTDPAWPAGYVRADVCCLSCLVREHRKTGPVLPAAKEGSGSALAPRP